MIKQYVKRTPRDDSLSAKLAVAERGEKGEMTCQQAGYRYGVQGCSTVMEW